MYVSQNLSRYVFSKVRSENSKLQPNFSLTDISTTLMFLRIWSGRKMIKILVAITLSFLTRCVCLLCWFEAKMLQRKRFSKKNSKFLVKIDVFLGEVQALKYGDYSPKIIYWKSDANSCFSRHTVSSEENGVRVGSLASQSIFDQTHFWAVITTEPIFSFFEVFNFRLKMVLLLQN